MKKQTPYAIVFIFWYYVLNYLLEDKTSVILYMILFVLVFIFFHLLDLTDKNK